MKIFAALLLFVTLSAQAHVFDCQSGDETETLVLEDNSAQILDITLINMLGVVWDLPFRGYTFINDPWFDLLVSTEMLEGKAGRAELRAHELQHGQTILSKYYHCTPRL